MTDSFDEESEEGRSVVYVGPLPEFLIDDVESLARMIALHLGTAPGWAARLDTVFLDVLKDLGNVSLHAGEVDVAQRAALDNHLLTAVKETFAHILDVVYELPKREQERLARMQAALSTVRQYQQVAQGGQPPEAAVRKKP